TPVPRRYIVVEPPPSRFTASYAPNPLINVAISVQVMPALRVDRPSTTAMMSVWRSWLIPTEVRGLRVGQADWFDGLDVMATPALTSCGCPETTPFIHVVSNARTPLAS